MELYSVSRCLWFCSNRLHRGRFGRSFSRSNSRNRSTSRVPPCHRNTPSDQQGGFSRHQPMNVALPERTETYPEKGRSQGGRAGQTSSTSTNQRTSFWGKHVRAKGWGRFVCVHCQPCERRQSRRSRTGIITIKETETNKKYKIMVETGVLTVKS